ncbi:glycosyltransferase family 2 protein [Taklimakanibacter lacteus]|uniref:glycosyltransferase family 2 protein n=1 Tax=Taklimakanibacter lacteus TaxID=2268456 RepID=UPI000E673D92
MAAEAVVLIPAYNAEATLADAVLSLFPAKHDFDVLIVDDGSRLPAESVVKGSSALEPYLKRIHILRHEPNRGLIATLNRGIEWALERKYQYIIRMDGDDLARSQRVDRQIDFMNAHPQIDVAGSQTKRFRHVPEDLDERRFPLEQPDIRRRMHWSVGFSHPTLIIRAPTFEKVGLYDPRYLHAEDFDWTWRCMRKVGMANLPDFLLNYRVSPNQVSARNRRRQLLSKARVLMREVRHGEIECLKGLAAAALVAFMPFHAKLALQRRLKNWLPH